MPLRVLHVNNLNAPIGGTETYLFMLLSALSDAGVEVGLMHGVRTEQDWPKDRWPTFFVPEVETNGRGGLLRRGPRRLDDLRATVERFAPDVIQLHNVFDPVVRDECCDLRPTIQFAHVQAAFSCPGGAKYLKTERVACHRAVGPFCLIAPTIQHCGSRRPWVQLAAYRRVVEYQSGSSKLARIVVGSEYMRDELLLNGVAARKIVVAPLPARLLGRQPNATRGAELQPIVLMVGRLLQDKGADVLLSAAERMTTACHIVIAGDGPQRPALEAMATSLRSRHRVTFAGWASREALEEWYARASVVAVPSLWPEPYGLVGVEAMSHGKPVVAFDVGGVGTWLENDVNGLLVPAKDVSGFAAALDRILSVPALAKRLGDRGHEIATTELSRERHVETILSVYRDALGSGGSAVAGAVSSP